MKKEITVEVFEDDFFNYSDDFPEYSIPKYSIPTNPDDFLKFFKDKIDLVPAEYKSTSKISINGHSDPCDTYGSVTILLTYTRPETDDEYNKRLEDERK